MEERPVLASGNRDIVDRFLYHAILVRIAPYIPRSITPNQITLAAFFCFLSGSLSLLMIESPVALLLQVAGIAFGLTLDCLDGLHARLSGQTSRFGSFFDHYCDQIAYLFFYFAIVIRFKLATPVFLFLIMARMTLAAVAFLHQAETRAFELPPTGPSFEYAVYCLFLCWSFVQPGDLVVLSNWVTNVRLLELVERFDLNHLTVMKVAILGYAASLPSLLIGYGRSAQRMLA